MPFAWMSVAIFATSGLPLWRLWRALSEAPESLTPYFLGGWMPPVGISLAVDWLALILGAVVTVIVLAISVTSLARRHFSNLYFAEVMILAGALQGVMVVQDLFTLFVFFEIAALAVYLLIAFEREAAALVASFKYLILSSLGILFFLFGIFIVYRETGLLTISGPFVVPPGSEGALRLGVAALVVGIGVRTAFIPFHTWLPEAHAYAPHPISALLSGVVIKVSFFAMVRVMDAFEAAYFYEPLLWIGAATAFIAVLRALAQRDVKKLLAYHSISQMGYVLAAFGVASVVGRDAAVHHAVNHALFKSLLFLTVGYAVSLSGHRDVYRIPKLGRREPVMAVAFWVGALAIAGIPPLNGYFSKSDVSMAVQEAALSPYIYPFIWVTGVGTVASFIKLGRIYSFLQPAGAQPEAGGSRVGLRRIGTLAPPVALGILCLAGGLVIGLPSWPSLASTGVTVAAGVGVFLVISRPGVMRFLAPLRKWNPSLEAVLTFFFLGLFLFAAVGYLS
jgi:multicomponent Na+:H+ antiporter subunit D